MSDDYKIITVNQLIKELQSLPEWAKELPVTASYDGGCVTGVYGVAPVKEGDRSIILIGD